MWWAIIKEAGKGFGSGVKWYIRRIKENKWWIIAFVIDMILVPIKIPLIAIACITKNGRRWVLYTFTELVEEED